MFSLLSPLLHRNKLPPQVEGFKYLTILFMNHGRAELQPSYRLKSLATWEGLAVEPLLFHIERWHLSLFRHSGLLEGSERRCPKHVWPQGRRMTQRLAGLAVSWYTPSRRVRGGGQVKGGLGCRGSLDLAENRSVQMDGLFFFHCGLIVQFIFLMTFKKKNKYCWNSALGSKSLIFSPQNTHPFTFKYTP